MPRSSDTWDWRPASHHLVDRAEPHSSLDPSSEGHEHLLAPSAALGPGALRQSFFILFTRCRDCRWAGFALSFTSMIFFPAIPCAMIVTHFIAKMMALTAGGCLATLRSRQSCGVRGTVLA